MSVVTTLLLTAWLAGRPNMPQGWTWPPSSAMKSAGETCLQRLDAAKIDWRPGKAARKIATPVVIPGRTLAGITLVSLRGRSATMDCHLAAAIVGVAPALQSLGVTSLQFRTLHEYRTVRKRGKRTRILSRHALALAVDVFAVGFADGAVLWVEHDWSESSQRLQAVAAIFAASEAFRTPLTPANDPADHGDHLHLEAHMPLAARPPPRRRL